MSENGVERICILSLLLSFILLSCNTHATNTILHSEEDSLKTENIVAKPNKFVWQQPVYDSTKKYIYLTFDDGPQSPGTENCFKTCKSLNIKGTFFMVGIHASNSYLKGVVDTIKENYPEILLANHSNTHTRERYRYFYEHPDMAHEDFLTAQKSLSVPYKIVRLPGNSAWVRDGEVKSSDLTRNVCKGLDSSGYNVIGWDVEWNFSHKDSYPVQSAQAMVDQVNYALQHNRTHVPNHVVILTHDRMFRTASGKDSLSRFIAALQQNPNYVFETINNYPKLKM